jgi:signal transduction histidine kinase
VSDTGVGIAPEDQEAVFEEFRQVGTADKKVEGTGLGLTLCRKFVELHGGRIWVKSDGWARRLSSACHCVTGKSP